MAAPPTDRSRAVRRVAVGAVALLCLVAPYGLVRQRRSARRRYGRTGPGAADGAAPAPAPILVLGLPHAGSIALHHFFQCNGVPSAHYCCGDSPKSSFSCGAHPTCGSCVLGNLRAGRPAFQGCGAYGAYAQFDAEAADPFAWFLPQHFALPLLQDGYPDAVWVLNRRADPHIWADSVLHWYSRSVRLLASFGVDYHQDPLAESQPQSPPPPLLGPDRDLTAVEVETCVAEAYDAARSGAAHARRRAALAEAYDRHLAAVRAFARAHRPAHRLVEVDVDDPRAGAALAAAFPGFRANCWRFDPQAYDDEWRDFTLKV